MDMNQRPLHPQKAPQPNSQSQSQMPKRDRSIGALLIDSRHLSATDAESVMRYARTHDMRFGDAAVKLGLVTRANVQHALARQFDYPYLALDDDAVSREVVAAYAPFTAPVEALRALRTQLLLRWYEADPPHKSIAVVSARPGEGRSFLAANLAVVFSQLGERTLLIDADLRNPRQHEIFQLPDRVGLSAILAGRGNENVIQRIHGLLGLSVMPAGAAPPNPQELLSRPAFGAMLSGFGSHYDVVILDTPAALMGADFQSVTAAAEGALLVTRRNFSRASESHLVTEYVTAAGATVVGAVLNDH
jgi:protein-tyrosine kinase